MSRSLFLLTVLLSLTACSGGLQLGAESDGGTDGGPALAGTWDVTVSNADTGPISGVVTMSATEFDATFGSSTLSYTFARPTFNWVGADSTNIDATHTAGTLDTGILPLPFGGSWSFSSPSDSTQNCSANFSATLVTASCSLGSNLWNDFPLDEGLDGSMSGTKTVTSASSFGDLGGEWTFTESDGAQWTLFFAGNTITFSVPDDDSLHGSLTMTFGDGTASGTTSGGIEISARKR